MKKLFGEFLIDKKIATENQVLKALIEQIQSLPSLCEIVYNKQILSDTEIIGALAHQMKNGSDFKSACVVRRVWSDKIEAEVSKVVKGLKKPLGEILVRNKIMDHETLTKALDQFLSENIVIPASASTTVTANGVTAPVAATGGAPVASTVTALSPKNKSPYPEFAEVEKLLLFFKAQNTDMAQITEKLKTIFNLVHKVKGVARFKSAEKFEKVLALFEKNTESCILGVKNSCEFDGPKFISVAHEILAVAVQMGSHVESEGSEKKFFDSIDNIQRYEGLWVQINADFGGKCA